jgi:hypothetical protein
LLTAKNIYRIILPLVIFTSILIIFATIVPNLHLSVDKVAYSFKPLGSPPTQPPPANNFSSPPQQQQQFQPAPVTTPPPANNFSSPPQQQQQFQPAPSIQPPLIKPPIIQPKLVKGPPASLQAKGTINSVIVVPQTKWIATGNWIMTINYGNLTGFLTNMSFFDERGTATHTHEFLNFRPDANYKIIAQLPNSSLFVRGLMDVGTNHKIVWKSVPTIIDIKGGKTISISVNDKATNIHFASQPILGVVSNLASGLKVQITPAKSTVSSGDDQPINVTVSDSTSNAPLAGVKISGVMIDASPGVKVLIKDMNSTEPIATSKIEGKKFSGVTDENGQFSVTEPISTGKKVGTYTIVVTASGKGYNPISEIETFNVEK